MNSRKHPLSQTGSPNGPIGRKDNSIEIILVADDSYTCSLVAEAYLKEETSAKIIFAKDGKEALELLKTEAIDLILLDIKMPEVSGLQVAKEAEAMGIPVIFLSACSKKQHEKELAEISYLYYLMKPVPRQEFQAALAKAGVVKSIQEE